MAIQWFLVALLTVAAYLVAVPLVEMERDRILSFMGDSTPGKPDSGLLVRVGLYGAGPIVGILSNQFPGLAKFLLSWLQPTLESLQ